MMITNVFHNLFHKFVFLKCCLNLFLKVIVFHLKGEIAFLVVLHYALIVHLKYGMINNRPVSKVICPSTESVHFNIL